MSEELSAKSITRLGLSCIDEDGELTFPHMEESELGGYVSLSDILRELKKVRDYARAATAYPFDPGLKLTQRRQLDECIKVLMAVDSFLTYLIDQFEEAK